MAKITLKGNEITTSGELPAVGSTIPDALLVKADLSEVKLSAVAGKRVLNIYPSIDTGICAASAREFNKRAAELNDATVLCISADLPFAGKRFCEAEGIDKVGTYSTFRGSFAKDFGLEITSGPLKGLCSRAVIVIDGDGKVLYTEQVPEIAQEPNYDAALKAL